MIQKKATLLLIIFTVPFICFSQLKKSIFFDKNWQESTSKNSQYYYCDCFVLENGGFDGEFTCFNIVSDQKVKSYNFKNNVLDGEIKEYHSDGSLKLQAYYNNGKAINEWKEWNTLGELVVDKVFDENNRIVSDKNKRTEYEKMYFGEKEFQAPIYTSECILLNQEKEKYNCSNFAMAEYYKHPPLPPSYFNNPIFSGKSFSVILKYLLSSKGKVIETMIIETSGDAFLDDLAQTHVLNMIPFEAAKAYESPIEYWIDAELLFSF